MKSCHIYETRRFIVGRYFNEDCVILGRRFDIYNRACDKHADFSLVLPNRDKGHAVIELITSLYVWTY